MRVVGPRMEDVLTPSGVRPWWAVSCGLVGSAGSLAAWHRQSGGIGTAAMAEERSTAASPRPQLAS